jgi:serine/threonine-protein kinase
MDVAIQNTVAQFGRYRLRARLSQSSICDVWLAEIDGAPLGSPAVLVKKLRPDAPQAEGIKEIFLQRAHLAKPLQHDNVGSVLDVVQIQRDVACVREFHDGKTLRQLIAAVGEVGNALPIWFAIHVARCICLALEYSHGYADDAGRATPVHHRCLSAENVFLTYQGQLKVTDFGLGREALLAKNSLTPMASTRVPAGTIAPSRSPEDQLARADLEAVGRILYELLTGVIPPPASESTLDFLPPSHHAPWVNVEVDQLLRKALSPSYPNRFIAASEFRAGLEEYLRNRRHDVSASHVAGLVTVLFSNECRDAPPATIRFDDGAMQLARLRSRRTTPPDPAGHSGFEHSAPTRPGLSVSAPPSGQVTRPTLPSPAMTSEESAHAPAAAPNPPAAPSSRASDSRVTPSEERHQPFHHDWDLALKHARQHSQLTPRSSGTYPTAKEVPFPPPPPVDPLEQAVIEFERGLELRQRGELNSAMAAWEKALELDPQHRVCRANLNLLKKKLGIP